MGRGAGVRMATSSPGAIFESSVPGTQEHRASPELGQGKHWTGALCSSPCALGHAEVAAPHHPPHTDQPHPKGMGSVLSHWLGPWELLRAVHWSRRVTGPAVGQAVGSHPCSGSSQAALHVQRPCAGGPYSEVLCWEQSHQELRSVCRKPVLFYTTHSP